MNQEHPITPPPELVQQWLGNYFGCVVNGELSDSEKYLATQAARWGADQELEACRLWVSENCDICSAVELIQCRRPEPPSLKEQALEQLESLEVAFLASHGGNAKTESIRRALDALPD